MKIFTVSQVNKYLKDIISNDYILNNLHIKGEISNIKMHYSGHLYFTLKDQTSLLKCVMFKSQSSELKFMPTDGMKVVIAGNISIYEKDGQYQFYCSQMQPDGVGALFIAFEQLKRKLSDEGLFSSEFKKAIPFFSSNIAVVTSKTGSVIRDIINISTRRFPGVSLKIFPVSVQGNTAASEIAHAISTLNQHKCADVIIIARGGGSLEELWAFNEEIVARAIFNSEIPIISAVGHETDYTISDMVADLRVPTPSAAAELVVPDIKEVKWKISSNIKRIYSSIKANISAYKFEVQNFRGSYAFKQPQSVLNNSKLQIDQNYKYLIKNINLKLHILKEQISSTAYCLNTLSPLKIIARGYSIVQNLHGVTVRSINNVDIDENITTIHTDGKLLCKVIKKLTN